eukprot:scaffold21430_cov15-Tisochrysis_lutea.AAC.1
MTAALEAMTTDWQPRHPEAYKQVSLWNPLRRRHPKPAPLFQALFLQDNPAHAFAASVAIMLPHQAAQELRADVRRGSGMAITYEEALQLARAAQQYGERVMGKALLAKRWQPTEAYHRLQVFQRP